MEDKKSLFTVLFIIFLDTVGFGIIIPIMPKLITSLSSATISESAKYGGLLLITYSLMMFLFSPLLGSLSDKYGRKPILLISLIGITIDYIFLSYAPNLGLFFVGRAIAGICGASITSAYAYIADISSFEKRAQNFGFIGVAFGLGFIIGPVIGGLLSSYGLRIPFIFTAVLSFINFLFCVFFLKESLPQNMKRSFSLKSANPFSIFSHIKKYPVLKGFFIGLTLLYIAGHSVNTIWPFYTKFKFAWSEKMIGYSLAVAGVFISIVQGGMIKVFIEKMGIKNSIKMGLTFFVIGFILFAFANKSWMMYIFMIPYAISGIVIPSIQATMTNEVSPREQGILQGIITSLMGLSNIIGPLFMSYLFYCTTGDNSSDYNFPGSPYIASSLLALIATVFISKSLSKVKDSHKY